MHTLFGRNTALFTFCLAGAVSVSSVAMAQDVIDAGRVENLGNQTSTEGKRVISSFVIINGRLVPAEEAYVPARGEEEGPARARGQERQSQPEQPKYREQAALQPIGFYVADKPDRQGFRTFVNDRSVEVDNTSSTSDVAATDSVQSEDNADQGYMRITLADQPVGSMDEKVDGQDQPVRQSTRYVQTGSVADSRQQANHTHASQDGHARYWGAPDNPSDFIGQNPAVEQMTRVKQVTVDADGKVDVNQGDQPQAQRDADGRTVVNIYNETRDRSQATRYAATTTPVGYTQYTYGASNNGPWAYAHPASRKPVVVYGLNVAPQWQPIGRVYISPYYYRGRMISYPRYYRYSDYGCYTRPRVIHYAPGVYYRKVYYRYSTGSRASIGYTGDNFFFRANVRY